MGNRYTIQKQFVKPATVKIMRGRGRKGGLSWKRF
jgi:hypothetical protein